MKIIYSVLVIIVSTIIILITSFGLQKLEQSEKKEELRKKTESYNYVIPKEKFDELSKFAIEFANKFSTNYHTLINYKDEIAQKEKRDFFSKYGVAGIISPASIINIFQSQEISRIEAIYSNSTIRQYRVYFTYQVIAQVKEGGQDLQKLFNAIPLSPKYVAMGNGKAERLNGWKSAFKIKWNKVMVDYINKMPRPSKEDTAKLNKMFDEKITVSKYKTLNNNKDRNDKGRIDRWKDALLKN